MMGVVMVEGGLIDPTLLPHPCTPHVGVGIHLDPMGVVPPVVVGGMAPLGVDTKEGEGEGMAVAMGEEEEDMEGEDMEEEGTEGATVEEVGVATEEEGEEEDITTDTDLLDCHELYTLLILMMHTHTYTHLLLWKPHNTMYICCCPLSHYFLFSMDKTYILCGLQFMGKRQ